MATIRKQKSASRRRTTTTSIRKNKIQMLDYMSAYIEQLRALGRFGSVLNYQKTMRSFSYFLKGRSVAVSDIDENLIAEYNAYLVRKGVVRNTISFYMRILRATYNRAVRQKLATQTYPFEEVYTGVDRTRKRAVGEDVVAQLHRLHLPQNSLALARDIFIFSFCTRGMAFVDIAYLTKSNLQDGYICYTRHKTGQRLCVRIEPAIEQIIGRYRTPDSLYLFPILSSADRAEAYEEYRNALNKYNRLLGILSRKLNCECHLTSYTSRHSWATAARNHNIPIAVISAGMGHTSEQTTRIYLSTLDNSVIDDANRWILKAIE